MKQSLTFIPTLREVPQNIESKSCQMLLRAGFIRQHKNGTYSYLPLAKRVLHKIEQIFRKEMEGMNGIEIDLPIVQSTDLFIQSGRLEYDNQAFIRYKDLNKHEHIIGQSHTELITSIVRDEIKTYKKLPLLLYQMQKRFDDEKHSHLERAYVMKDAFSFHASSENLCITFEQMTEAYHRIFSKLGLKVSMVEADPGIFGDESFEWIVSTNHGEEMIAFSDQSNYRANIHIAPIITEYEPSTIGMGSLEKIATPNVQTIQELCDFLGIEPAKCIKSLVLKVDGEMMVILVRGDHQISERKIAKVLNAKNVQFATEDEIVKAIGCSKGSIGPLKLPLDMKVIADLAIKAIINGVSGANEDGFHYKNVNPNRDFAINLFADIRIIQEGDPSPDGQGTIQLEKGMKIGRMTKLSIPYAEKMKAMITNEEGKLIPIHMASYEVNVTRVFSILAEQYQDDRGFVWPKQLAPYDLHLMAVNVHDQIQFNLAEQLYHILTTYHYHVLFDDRDNRIGVKFSDADLIGLPIRVTIGKKAAEGIVEVTIRETGETFECAKEELIDHLNEFYRSL